MQYHSVHASRLDEEVEKGLIILHTYFPGFRYYAARILLTGVIAVILPLTPPLSGNSLADQATSLSLQGFSGVLNTPTGHVQSEGTFKMLYSNQIDDRWRGISNWQDNYLFSVGLFDFAEIGGRLTNNTAGNTISAQSTSGVTAIRDLSANVKITSAPFTRSMPYVPALALGIQDIGGGGAYLRTTYLAMSEDIWRLRLSVGYGHGPNRMKGGFGGMELKAHDWIFLLGEYDTRNTNVGIRLITPPLPYVPASLTFIAKSALNRPSSLDIAFGLSIPLDFKEAGKNRGRSSEKTEPEIKTPAETTPAQQSTNQDTTTGAQTKIPATGNSLHSLLSRLIEAGFVNVRVGVLGETVLVVEYENVRFNHNELDAIGVVAGIASSADLDGIESMHLVVKRKGLRMLVVSAPLKDMRNWLSEPGNSRVPEITVKNNTSLVKEARFIDGDSNPDWLRPSLMLYPGLKTFVGTEAGVFDYLLSLKPDMQMTVWKGGVLNARWDVPVVWSDNFNNDQQFSSSRNNPLMDRLMFFQGINLASGLIANLGGGMIVHGRYGTLNELTWSPGSGMHRFRLAQAYAGAGNSDGSTARVWLGSYRMYLAPLDLFLEGTAGRFWGQDTGALISIKRFFGDTAVDLYYKNTETLEKKRWQAAGVQFSFPFTPRRDMKRSTLQVRGTDEWSYFQETVLTVNGQRTNDSISAALGVNLLPATDIYRSYTNRDRLNEEYILAHKQRLKEAWQTFRHSLSDASPGF
jgi:hypothetical protein